MKVAYHFKVSSPTNAVYGPSLIKRVFSEVLTLRGQPVHSKVAIGELLVWDAINKDNHAVVINKLLQFEQQTWKRFSVENIHYLINGIVFVICFETISKEVAEQLHIKLCGHKDYIGAYEINDADQFHWIMYGERIGHTYRIIGAKLYLLYPDQDTMPEEPFIDFSGTGFKKIETEFTNLRYSVFDDNHTFENARRTAEWKAKADNLLATVVDNIIFSLTDAAPELNNKLWAMLDTYHSSETTEQLAQVMTSCRRIFEYVTDCIFPATNDIINGHSLKQDKYKNRLYQYANETSKSDTNIDVIVAATDLLFQQWDKLNKLANKGVHSEVYREETRRCIIRTILLLDDIVSLRSEPFFIQTDTGDLFDELRNKYSE